MSFDQGDNTCSIRSSDYLLISDVVYQPTNTLLIVHQLITISREICAFECLSKDLCITATFKKDIDQCILYFENVINGQLIPFTDGYVLSINTKISGLSQEVLLLSPSNLIFAIWNSAAGRSSSSSSGGFGYGQYPPAQSALVAIDRLRSTAYLNYGNTSQYVNSILGGIGSGFYVITNLGKPSVLTQFRIATVLACL